MRFPTHGIFQDRCIPFPLPPLLSLVLGGIRATWRPALLLAPAWSRQPWYSSVVELSVAPAVRLPLVLFPLLQGNFLNIQAARLDVVRDGFRGPEFSTRATGFLAQSLEPSTSLVYVS